MYGQVIGILIKEEFSKTYIQELTIYNVKTKLLMRIILKFYKLILYVHIFYSTP